MLDVLDAERLAQQRIVAQVDHADGEIIAGTPPRVHAAQLLRIEWPRSDGVGGGLPRDTTFRRHAAPPESIEIRLVGFPHATGHGLACQISLAYSAIVRSLENFPDAATFRIALRAQACGIGVQTDQPRVRLEIGRQVGQVHVVVAVREQRVEQRREHARARPG